MMDCASVQFSRHALERMFERAISPDVVRHLLGEGEEIASYPDDQPLPSSLILGFYAGRAVHLVVARNPATRECVVVTIYCPEPTLWSDGFKTRR